MMNSSELSSPKRPFPYKKIKELGEGQFATVHLMTTLENPEKRFAVKIQKIRNRQKEIQREHNIHETLVNNHENIIKVLDSKRGPDCHYLIMEYAEIGDLFAVIDDLCESKTQYYFRQLVQGVKYIHGQGVVHRDIKPENLLISKDGILKICDFGVARIFRRDNEQRKISGKCGSPGYIPPEIHLLEEYEAQPVDIWAVGVVLLNMLTNVQLWEKATCDDPTYQEWTTGALMNEEPFSSISDSAYDLLLELLNKKPEKRATIEKIESSNWYNMDFK